MEDNPKPAVSRPSIAGVLGALIAIASFSALIYVGLGASTPLVILSVVVVGVVGWLVVTVAPVVVAITVFCGGTCIGLDPGMPLSVVSLLAGGVAQAALGDDFDLF